MIKIKLAVGLLTVGFLVIAAMITAVVVSNYRYEKNYSCYWTLADKSSTIVAKRAYIEQFVAALESGYESGQFAANNAIFTKTPDNNFKYNLEALKSFASRLNEISGMNPSSFEYNAAIQQITAQEQGEAKALLEVFDGCYTLANYPYIWNWIAALLSMAFVVIVVVGFASAMVYLENNASKNKWNR